MSQIQVTAKALIEMGGKLWQKGEIERVYIKSDVVKEIVGFAQMSELGQRNIAPILKRIDSEGAWFNVTTSQFESKKPTVQNFFDNGPWAKNFNQIEG